MKHLWHILSRYEKVELVNPTLQPNASATDSFEVPFETRFLLKDLIFVSFFKGYGSLWYCMTGFGEARAFSLEMMSHKTIMVQSNNDLLRKGLSEKAKGVLSTVMFCPDPMLVILYGTSSIYGISF